jgi:hypothetical protein
MEGPLGTVDSLAGMGSRSAHLSREVPVMMTGNHQSQKHNEGGAPAKEPQSSR